LKGRDSVRVPGVADSCSCFSEGLSQISGVDGSSGMVVDFVASGSGGHRDPECDGLAVDHATPNRWILAYAPLLERRLGFFRKPHCGSLCIDESSVISTFGILLEIRLDISSNLKRNWFVLLIIVHDRLL
jgi:hypothetical protein